MESSKDFVKVGELLNDAIDRLFQRVVERKKFEFIEQIKNAKENGKQHKTV